MDTQAQLNSLLGLTATEAGWRLSHLINLNPGWQANITDDEYVAVGTGESIEDAINVACLKALTEDFAGRIFDRTLIDRGEVVDLRSLLGLNIPKVTITRRL